MDWLNAFFSNKVAVRVLATIGILVALVLGIRACNQANKAKVVEDTTETTTSSSEKIYLTQFEEDQKRLIQRYGDPGDGYYWSDEGKRMALGDQNLTEREVATTFLRSVATLDFATAQKYAYRDQVLRTVNQYFDSDAEFTYDESFKKAMYQEVLLSLEVVGIESQATFADDKANLTVKVKLLDLSNKDFWQVDSDEIYKNLYQYKRNESDSTKARNYLYDYVLNYWKSEEAQKKEVTINLVLTRTGDGGWLVSQDTDLDNYAKYADGETVINNMLQGYDTWTSIESNLDGIE